MFFSHNDFCTEYADCFGDMIIKKSIQNSTQI